MGFGFDPIWYGIKTSWTKLGCCFYDSYLVFIGSDQLGIYKLDITRIVFFFVVVVVVVVVVVFSYSWINKKFEHLIFCITLNMNKRTKKWNH